MRRIVRICSILSLVLLAGCGSAQPSSVASATPVPIVSPTAGPSLGPSLMADLELAAMIPGPGDTPAGLDHDDTVTGPETLTMVVISGRRDEFAALSGFLDGRATTFSGSNGALLTAALAFDSPVMADMAMHHYQNELSWSDGYGFGEGERHQFVFEGVCDTGPNPALDGLEESICIWHTGRVVFLVGGPLPMTTIRAISEGLHDRATHLGA